MDMLLGVIVLLVGVCVGVFISYLLWGGDDDVRV